MSQKFKVGDRLIAHGWNMLEGIEDGGVYGIKSIKFLPYYKQNQLNIYRIKKDGSYFKKGIGHLEESILGKIGCFKRGDINGIEHISY